MAKTKNTEPEESAAATSASVLDSRGQHIRTYTLEVHGDNFADLAKEFSAHTPGSTVQLI